MRKHKTIPLARVQGVDVSADLFNRVLGLVELRVQTAGGGDEPEAGIGSVRSPTQRCCAPPCSAAT